MKTILNERIPAEDDTVQAFYVRPPGGEVVFRSFSRGAAEAFIRRYESLASVHCQLVVVTCP